MKYENNKLRLHSNETLKIVFNLNWVHDFIIYTIVSINFPNDIDTNKISHTKHLKHPKSQ